MNFNQTLKKMKVLQSHKLFSSGVYSSWKPYLSKSTDILPGKDFGKSWSHRLEYYLSKSLKVCDIYCT